MGFLSLATFAELGRPRARVRQPLDGSANSGAEQVDTPGNGGKGMTAAGTIEMSNVDLAQTFTSMITAQRGFQANSRVISTVGRDAAGPGQPQALGTLAAADRPTFDRARRGGPSRV